MSDEEELKSLVPQIIEGGKTIVRPDVVQAVTQLAQLGQLVKIRKSLEREEFQGEVDTRVLLATDAYNHIGLIDSFPYCPWVSAFFINDGPNTVYIGINKPYEWVEIEAGETRTIDHSSAKVRLELLYYRCNPGETASVRVEAYY